MRYLNLLLSAIPSCDVYGQVCPESIPLEESFEEALNDRLVLVFSGKQRLARYTRTLSFPDLVFFLFVDVVLRTF